MAVRVGSVIVVAMRVVIVVAVVVVVAVIMVAVPGVGVRLPPGGGPRGGPLPPGDERDESVHQEAREGEDRDEPERIGHRLVPPTTSGS